MTKKTRAPLGYLQVLRPDGTVYSLQQLLLNPSEGETYTPEDLLQAYLAYIRKFTLGLVRPVSRRSRISFRLVGIGITLLRFEPPVCEIGPGRGSIVLRCCGGVLRHSTSGPDAMLRFDVERSVAGAALTLELSGYRPMLLGAPPPARWRRSLYRRTQSALHRWLTLAFLRRLCRDLTGESPPEEIFHIPLVEGDEI